MSLKRVESIADSVAALRAAYRPVVGRGWDFDGFRVWVETNEPHLLSELERYFSDFRQLAAQTFEQAESAGPITRISAIQLDDPPDFAANHTLVIGEYKPSVKGPKEAFFDLPDGRVVHKLRTGMWFLFGRDDHLAIGPCLQNPNQVINFVNNRMIQWALHRGALLGHAAAVCHQAAREELPRTIAIAGFSGMGKSTLSLHLLGDRRLDFLSNDRVMIHPARAGGPATIQGIPKHPRINPGTILHNPDLVSILGAAERERFAALEPDELWQLEHKYDGLIRECFPQQRFVLHGRLVGLVLLNWTRSGTHTVIREIDPRVRRELLPALIKEPGVFYLPGAGEAPSRDAARYLDYLEGVTVLELAGKVDFDKGRAAALELLGVA